MFLERFIGINLGKHEKIDVSFTDKINVIRGKSFSGKSCLVRGISYLFFNNIATKSIRKEGTSETTLTAFLNDNGVKYEVERIVSDKTNAYIIRKDGVEERFDAIGRSIPDEVLAVLKSRVMEVDKETINLNYDAQDDVRFLMHKAYPDTFKAKLFNILTGNEVQDILFKELNKDSLAVGRKQKSEEEEIEGLTEKQTTLKNTLVEKEQEYQINAKILKKIKRKYETYLTYVDLHQRLTKIKENINESTVTLKNLKVIDNKALTLIETKLKDYEAFKSLYKRLSKAQSQKCMANTELSKITAKKVDFDKISGQINRLDTLNSLKSRLITNNSLISSVKTDFESSNKKCKEFEDKYHELVKCLGLCEKCPFK